MTEEEAKEVAWAAYGFMDHAESIALGVIKECDAKEAWEATLNGARGLLAVQLHEVKIQIRAGLPRWARKFLPIEPWEVRLEAVKRSLGGEYGM